MIRAKTLLASVLTLGTGLTMLALNSRHDGFVPATSAVPPTVGTVLTDAGQPLRTPAHTIAKLPKLAPLATPTSIASAPRTPTVSEIASATDTDDANDLSAPQGTGAEGTASKVVEPPAIEPHVAARSRQNTTVEHSAPTRTQASVTKPAQTKTVAGIPLPVRLPQEYQIVRAQKFAHTNQAQDTDVEVYEDGFLHDPAVPIIQSRETLRLKRLKRAQRLQRNRRRAAIRQRKQLPKTVAAIEVSDQPEPAPKRLRHRKPFDSNRN